MPKNWVWARFKFCTPNTIQFRVQKVCRLVLNLNTLDKNDGKTTLP